MARLEIVDVTDEARFELIPPCADARFDHRTCDYWEDPERGSKLSRPALLTASSAPAPRRPAPDDNPFAPPARKGVDNPFRPQSLSAELGPREGDDLFGTPAFN